MDPRLPPSPAWDSAAARRARRVGARAGREQQASVAFGAGRLAHAAAPVRDAAGPAARAPSWSRPGCRPTWRRPCSEVRDGYTKFRKTQTFREPILAFYRSLYLFPALLILFGASWLALYLSRRITTPMRLVAEGAERIAAGQRGVRVDFPTSSDEFRALIASFNRMSERLARSEEEVEFSRAGLLRKNQELEERRRLTDTVLETVGTGVVVVDEEAAVTAVNVAAQRLLDVEPGAVGLPLDKILRGPGPRGDPRRSCCGCSPAASRARSAR